MAATPDSAVLAALDVKVDQAPCFMAVDANQDWHLSPASAIVGFIVVNVDRPGVRAAATAGRDAANRALLRARHRGFESFLRCDDLSAYLVGGARVVALRAAGGLPPDDEVAMVDAAVGARLALDDAASDARAIHRAFISDRYPLPDTWRLTIELPPAGRDF